MGKLVAIGGADIGHPHGELIMTEIDRLVGERENKKMVYIPTAHGDRPNEEENVNTYWGNRGYEVTHLYLTDMGLSDEYIRETILNADLIYACGGNLKLLMDTWRKRNVVELMRKAYENGTVLAGNSSGAMCWFHFGCDDCGLDGGFMFIEGVDLFPYCFGPHFQNEKWHKFSERVKMQQYDGIGVDDSTAIVFNNGRVSIIKNDPKPENSAFIMRASNNYELEDLGKIEGDFIL